MAQNLIINGVSYQSVPVVQIPKSGGGTASFIDTTIASGAAGAAQIMSGYKAYANGDLVTGSATVPSVSQDSSTHILTIQ